MRRPPKGKVWLHIDRLGKRNQRIWAVQSWDGDKALYQTAMAVIVAVDGYTQQWREGQPRAVIEFDDAVVKETSQPGILRIGW